MARWFDFLDPAGTLQRHLQPDEQLRHWAVGTRTRVGLAVLLFLTALVLGLDVTLLLFGRGGPQPQSGLLLVGSMIATLAVFSKVAPFNFFHIVGLSDQRLVVLTLALPFSGRANASKAILTHAYPLASLHHVKVSMRSVRSALILQQSTPVLKILFRPRMAIANAEHVTPMLLELQDKYSGEAAPALRGQIATAVVEKPFAQCRYCVAVLLVILVAAFVAASVLRRLPGSGLAWLQQSWGEVTSATGDAGADSGTDTDADTATRWKRCLPQSLPGDFHVIEVSFRSDFGSIHVQGEYQGPGAHLSLSVTTLAAGDAFASPAPPEGTIVRTSTIDGRMATETESPDGWNSYEVIGRNVSVMATGRDVTVGQLRAAVEAVEIERLELLHAGAAGARAPCGEVE